MHECDTSEFRSRKSSLRSREKIDVVFVECLGSCWQESKKEEKVLINLVYLNTIVGKRNEKARECKTGRVLWSFSFFSLFLWTFCFQQFTQRDIFSSERVWMIVWFPLEMRWSAGKSFVPFQFLSHFWVEIVTYQTNQAQDQSDLLCFFAKSQLRSASFVSKPNKVCSFDRASTGLLLVSLCEQIVLWYKRVP